MRYFAASQVVLFLCLTMVLLADGDQMVLTALAAGAWVLATASQAYSDRALGMLGRLVVFQRAAVAGVLLYGAATLGLLLGPHSALTFFVALMLIATIANGIFLIGLDWRRECAIYLISLAILTSICAAALAARHI
jgi:hypothetical protein